MQILIILQYYHSGKGENLQIWKDNSGLSLFARLVLKKNQKCLYKSGCFKKLSPPGVRIGSLHHCVVETTIVGHIVCKK